MQEKRQILLAHERRLANHVARTVIEKPVLSVWMVLVPIFFVYYFYRLKKFAQGREDFVQNFMKTRNRAMEAACESLASDARPNVQKVVARSSAPKETHGVYAEWVRVLIEQYRDLLKAEGDTVDDLIRSVYRRRANYLLSLNQLGNAERRFNAVLRPHLDDGMEDAGGIIRMMEKATEAFRRKEAERIFP